MTLEAGLPLACLEHRLVSRDCRRHRFRATAQDVWRKPEAEQASFEARVPPSRGGGLWVGRGASHKIVDWHIQGEMAALASVRHNFEAAAG